MAGKCTPGSRPGAAAGQPGRRRSGIRDHGNGPRSGRAVYRPPMATNEGHRRVERTRRLGLRWAAGAFDATGAVANIPPRRSFVSARSDNVSVRADVDSARAGDDDGRTDLDSARADHDHGHADDDSDRVDDDSGRVDVVGEVATFVRGEGGDVGTGADDSSSGIGQACELLSGVSRGEACRWPRMSLQYTRNISAPWPMSEAPRKTVDV